MTGDRRRKPAQGLIGPEPLRFDATEGRSDIWIDALELLGDLDVIGRRQRGLAAELDVLVDLSSRGQISPTTKLSIDLFQVIVLLLIERRPVRAGFLLQLLAGLKVRAEFGLLPNRLPDEIGLELGALDALACGEQPDAPLLRDRGRGLLQRDLVGELGLDLFLRRGEV
ncbi:hypothetical protein, partial [Bradyrhizobium liaoningense]|uniref:hypothetical protein n=1 Tax=Bradyrhizobium liaoningense TaxID=43992 RepID=UPI001BA9BC38